MVYEVANMPNDMNSSIVIINDNYTILFKIDYFKSKNIITFEV